MRSSSSIPWFCYEVPIQAAGEVPVSITLARPRSSPDPRRLAEVITPRTRAVRLTQLVRYHSLWRDAPAGSTVSDARLSWSSADAALLDVDLPPCGVRPDDADVHPGDRPARVGREDAVGPEDFPARKHKGVRRAERSAMAPSQGCGCAGDVARCGLNGRGPSIRREPRRVWRERRRRRRSPLARPTRPSPDGTSCRSSRPHHRTCAGRRPSSA
jgi:hypothetical protein